MKRTTILKMFQDDNTGDYGFAHENAIDRGFNAFYAGATIFHDIFEHWFEDVHKNFSGSNSFNIGGEIAAMGSLAYYISEYGLSNRSINKYRPYMEVRDLISTQDMIDQKLTDGYEQFCDNLITVPYQKPVKDYYLTNVINEHKQKLKESKEKPFDTRYADEYGIEANKYFRDSLQTWKLERLYRLGYKMAEKIAPYSQENLETLEGFIDFWDKFCKNVDAEELYNIIRKLEINVYSGSKMKWTAFFITQDGQRINAKHVRYIDDLYVYEDEY